MRPARCCGSTASVGEVVGGVAIDGEIDAFEVRAEEEVVAIARSCEHVLRRDLPAGAGAVLDHDALPEALAEALGDVARRQIGRPTGREADHEAYRLLRILRKRHRNKDRGQVRNYFASYAHHCSARGQRTFITTPDPSSRSSACTPPPWNSAISRAM